MSESMLAPNDRELVQQLLDDIGILDDQFLVGVPRPAATRAIFVPILRRWIAEGLFHRVQKLILPMQATFAVAVNAGAMQ